MKKGLALLLLALLIGSIGLFAQDEPIVTIIINTSMPELSQISIAPNEANPTYGSSLTFNFMDLADTQDGLIGFLKYSTNIPNGINLEISGEALKTSGAQIHTIPYTLSLGNNDETQTTIKVGYVEEENTPSQIISTPSGQSSRYLKVVPIYLEIPGSGTDYTAGSYEG